MSEFDLILCTICALLIWLLWQQLEKVKLKSERRKVAKSRSQKKVLFKLNFFTNSFFLIQF